MPNNYFRMSAESLTRMRQDKSLKVQRLPKSEMSLGGVLCWLGNGHFLKHANSDLGVKLPRISRVIKGQLYSPQQIFLDSGPHKNSRWSPRTIHHNIIHTTKRVPASSNATWSTLRIMWVAHKIYSFELSWRPRTGNKKLFAAALVCSWPAVSSFCGFRFLLLMHFKRSQCWKQWVPIYSIFCLSLPLIDICCLVV